MNGIVLLWALISIMKRFRCCLWVIPFGFITHNQQRYNIGYVKRELRVDSDVYVFVVYNDNVLNSRPYIFVRSDLDQITAVRFIRYEFFFF